MSRVCDTDEYAKLYKGIQHMLLPCLYSTGIVSNIIVVIVLIWGSKKSTTNRLLASLAVWDMLYLTCLLAEIIIVWTHDWMLVKDIENTWKSIACNLVESCTKHYNDVFLAWYPHQVLYMWYILARVFQIASIYQTISITMFRYISVCWPLVAEKHLTTTVGRICTALCLMLGISVHIPSFLFAAVMNGYKSPSDVIPDERVNTTIFQLLYSDHTKYETFVKWYHFGFYNLVLFFVLPFIVLLVLSVLLLRQLKKSTASNHRADKTAKKENRAVTRVVIMVVVVFLFTYIVKPFYLVDIFLLDGRITSFFYDNKLCVGYIAVSLLVYIFPILNSVVNLYIYIGFRKSFRNDCKMVFKKLWRRCKQN